MFWLGVKATILFIMIFVLSMCQAWFFEEGAKRNDPEGGRTFGSMFQLFTIIDVILFIHHVHLYLENS